VSQNTAKNRHMTSQTASFRTENYLNILLKLSSSFCKQKSKPLCDHSCIFYSTQNSSVDILLHGRVGRL